MTIKGSWLNRGAKLAAMSPDELRLRTAQALRQRLDAWRYRLGGVPAPRVNTASYDHDPTFFFAAEDLPALLRLLRDRLPTTCATLVERADRICDGRFDLLGYRDLRFGDDDIDWHLDPVSGRRSPFCPWHKVPYLDHAVVGDAKVTWELNRHQHWVTLAKAYLLTGRARYVDEIDRQRHSWWASNPYPMGTNWASALEVGFRSLSWLWVKHLLAAAGALPADLMSAIVRGLARNGRHLECYLSTYFSPNTHLLGEAVALFFIGVLEPGIKPARRWRDKGWQIILEQSGRQVLVDGLHFERSSYYHVYALDLFLHARILASRNGIDVPRRFDEVLCRQLEALAALGSFGDVFEFGDDDGGRVFDGSRNRSEHLLDPLATGAALFEHPGWKALTTTIPEETIWLLGEPGVRRFDRLAAVTPDSCSRTFEASGLYVMADSRPVPRRLLIGPGPRHVPGGGHAHADLLALQMAIGQTLVLGDSGTFVYVEAGDRDRFRGTAAHNTLVVDGHSQAIEQGPFSWGSFPDLVVEQWLSGEYFDLFKGHHDGYATPEAGLRHTRWVFDLKGRGVLVRDLVEGSSTVRLDLRWNLGPELELEALDGAKYIARIGEDPVLQILTTRQLGRRAHIDTGWLSPAYGSEEQRIVLRLSLRGTLPAEFVTLMIPTGCAAGTSGSLRRMDAGRAAGEGDPGVTGYEYQTEAGSLVFCFGAGNWRCRGTVLDSDGEFACCKVDALGRVSEALAIGGSRVRLGEQTIEPANPTAGYWIWKS